MRLFSSYRIDREVKLPAFMGNWYFNEIYFGSSDSAAFYLTVPQKIRWQVFSVIAFPVFYISLPSSFPYHFLLVFLPMPSMWACLFPFLKFPCTTFLSSVIHRPEKMYRPLSSVAAVSDVWDGRPLYHDYLAKMEIAKGASISECPI